MARRTAILDTYVDPVFKQVTLEASAAGFDAKFAGGAPIGRALDAGIKGVPILPRLHAMVTPALGINFFTMIRGVERKNVATLTAD